MKTKLIVVFFLVIILWGCKEEKKMEIIPDYDKIYLPPNQLTELPQLLNGNDQALLDTIFKTYYKMYPSFDSMKNRPTLEYKFMINEKGLIEKVFLGKNNDEQINQLVLKTIRDWKYKPGIKNGKIVKSQLPMMISFMGNLPPINEDNYKAVVENMPGPIGGIQSIQEKITYPEKAKQQGIQGKVIIQVFIDENGNVVYAKILSGIGGGCDEAAIDAVKQTKFNPGRQDGKPVKVQVTIPIVFKLQ